MIDPQIDVFFELLGLLDLLDGRTMDSSRAWGREFTSPGLL